MKKIRMWGVYIVRSRFKNILPDLKKKKLKSILTPKSELLKLVNEITPDNRYEEVNWGKKSGNEVW